MSYRVNPLCVTDKRPVLEMHRCSYRTASSSARKRQQQSPINTSTMNQSSCWSQILEHVIVARIALSISRRKPLEQKLENLKKELLFVCKECSLLSRREEARITEGCPLKRTIAPRLRKVEKRSIDEEEMQNQKRYRRWGSLDA